MKHCTQFRYDDNYQQENNKTTPTMSHIPDRDSLQYELEMLDAPARRDRQRGEQQWRDAVDAMEADDALPVHNPGSIPNWIPLLMEG